MSDSEALKAALDLFHLPSRARTMRASPPPNGTKLLLRLAIGDTDAINEAVLLTGRPACAVRQAAIFFIEQILLDPDSDEYRTLGLEPTATMSELRTHMALLLKWLHPDLSSNDDRSIMARRVIRAWKQVNLLEQQRLQRKTTGPYLLAPNAKPRSQRSAQAVGQIIAKPKARYGTGRTLRLGQMLRTFADVVRRKFIHCRN
jgi:hypothetical protein